MCDEFLAIADAILNGENSASVGKAQWKLLFSEIFNTSSHQIYMIYNTTYTLNPIDEKFHTVYRWCVMHS